MASASWGSTPYALAVAEMRSRISLRLGIVSAHSEEPGAAPVVVVVPEVEVPESPRSVRVGIVSRWPICRKLLGEMPLALAIAATVLPVLAAMPDRVSPDWTV